MNLNYFFESDNGETFAANAEHYSRVITDFSFFSCSAIEEHNLDNVLLQEEGTTC